MEARQARRGLLAAEERLLDCEAAVMAARRAFDADQRARRAALTAELDAEARRELDALVRETDRVAAEWRQFWEASRQRDARYLETGPRNAFEVPQYGAMAFAPLTDTPAEESQWSAFRARITAPR